MFLLLTTASSAVLLPTHQGIGLCASQWKLFVSICLSNISSCNPTTHCNTCKWESHCV